MRLGKNKVGNPELRATKPNKTGYLAMYGKAKDQVKVPLLKMRHDAVCGVDCL
jgi:hypothetical protein